MARQSGRYENRRIDGNGNGWEVHRNVARTGGCLCLLKLQKNWATISGENGVEDMEAIGKRDSVHRDTARE